MKVKINSILAHRINHWIFYNILECYTKWIIRQSSNIFVSTRCRWYEGNERTRNWNTKDHTSSKADKWRSCCKGQRIKTLSIWFCRNISELSPIDILEIKILRLFLRKNRTEKEDENVNRVYPKIKTNLTFSEKLKFHLFDFCFFNF